jgi:hypothetical protein
MSETDAAQLSKVSLVISMPAFLNLEPEMRLKLGISWVAHF